MDEYYCHDFHHKILFSLFDDDKMVCLFLMVKLIIAMIIIDVVDAIITRF